MRTITKLLLVTAIFLVGCTPKEETSATAPIDEIYLEKVLEGVPDEVASNVITWDQGDGLGSSHRAFANFKAADELQAKRFIHSYEQSFKKLLLEKNALVRDHSISPESEQNLSHGFDLSYERDGQKGHVEMFLYQGADQAYYMRVVFFETR